MVNAKWIRKRYPHMSKEEAQIWTDFLKTFEIPFLKIEYDVHLGEGIPPKPGEPEWLTRLKRAITRKRVDAIAETEQDIWIFEVKPRIGMSALGPVSYTHLTLPTN